MATTSIRQAIRTPAQLGAALRRHRRQRGLSQDQLAQAVSLRQATVSALERGAPGTKLQTVMDALSALGLEIVLRERASAPAPEIEELF
jgi:HTH-type transcriptional regulator/antitoxin HipB